MVFGGKLMNLAKKVVRKLNNILNPVVPYDDSYLYSKFPQNSLEKRLFLNVGAGSFRHKFWTNLDKSTDWYENHQEGGNHIEFDLVEKKSLPFEDSSVETIYTSHTIEHVKDEHVRRLFEESFRVLKKGGVLRITTPDAKKLYTISKLNNKEWWLSWRKDWFLDPTKSLCKSIEDVQEVDFLVREVATKKCRFFSGPKIDIDIETLSQNFKELDYSEFMSWLTEGMEFDPKFPGNHINFWDHEKLDRFLKDAGFNLRLISLKNESILPIYSNAFDFDTTQPKMSLYMEAVKAR